jgi:hypothetical protein
MQNDIGWSLVLEGWISIDWAVVQQDYYKSKQSRKTGRQRNAVFHESENLASQQKAHSLNRQIHWIFIFWQGKNFRIQRIDIYFVCPPIS